MSGKSEFFSCSCEERGERVDTHSTAKDPATQTTPPQSSFCNHCIISTCLGGVEGPGSMVQQEPNPADESSSSSSSSNDFLMMHLSPLPHNQSSPLMLSSSSPPPPSPPPPAELLYLPAVLKREIASYLTPKDASRMAKCNRAINHDIAISKLSMKIATGAIARGWRYERFRDLALEDLIPMLEDDSTISLSDEEGLPKHRLRIPFMENRTHSIRVKFQYLGGDDTRLYVVAQQSVQSSFREGRIVWEYATDDFCGDSNVLFMPVDGEKYYIYADPGPYNQVCLQHITVHVAVFDDARCNLIHHFQKMFRRGAIRDYVEGGTYFYVKMLQNVTQSLQNQRSGLLQHQHHHHLAGDAGWLKQQQHSQQHSLQEEPPACALDPALLAYLRATGIPSDASSLSALDDIARFLSLYIGYTEKEYREMLDTRGRKAEWDPITHHPGVTVGFEDDDVDDETFSSHRRSNDDTLNGSGGGGRPRRRKALARRIWRSILMFLESRH